MSHVRSSSKKDVRRNLSARGSEVKPLSLSTLSDQIIACTRCERLCRWCADVAATKRRSFAEWDYWGKPVPGFGDPAARLWIIGLAPAAHGANRTGRVFTGDRSGDFLYAALYRKAFANQPTSTSRDDGLELTDCYISATVRCAPPANKPSPREQANCAGFLDREWELLHGKRVILALGKIAWDASIALARRKGAKIAALPKFAHGSAVGVGENLQLVGSYHVSQQNTFTGKLTERMFDAVLEQCRRGFSL